MRDLTGFRSHYLIVLSEAPREHFKNRRWLCRCDCGSTTVVFHSNLVGGHTKSCGCASTLMAPRMDLTGQRFGRLVALSEASKTHPKSRRWFCQCDCGVRCSVQQGNLLNNHTRSCGCLAKDTPQPSRRTHGCARPGQKWPEYKIWTAMKTRCHSPSCPSYDRYGGRGIVVCTEWMTFENFIRDMGRRPSPSHTIERVNNEQGYSPDNCVWADRVTQQNNRRVNRRVTFNGETHTIAEWSRITGIPRAALYARLSARGWDTARALTTPRLRPKHDSPK